MALNSSLVAANAARWKAAKLTRSGFGTVALRLVAQKRRYQEIEKATGVPWFVVAVIHERESSQDFTKQLSQGDPLGSVSTHVPKGRGPFLNHPNDPPHQDAFYRAALDALVDCAPHASKNTDWTAGGSLTLLEGYNGLGYFNKGRPSPYIWSGTDQYVSGKYVADGVYDANAVDKQLGCAGLLMEIRRIDPTALFADEKTASAPESAPAPTPVAAPEAPKGAIQRLRDALFKRY